MKAWQRDRLGKELRFNDCAYARAAPEAVLSCQCGAAIN
jgi:hypothetical protein